MAHHVNEPHGDSHNARLNSLRAGVLGANDGIVSVAALLLGVVGSGGVGKRHPHRRLGRNRIGSRVDGAGRIRLGVSAA